MNERILATQYIKKSEPHLCYIYQLKPHSIQAIIDNLYYVVVAIILIHMLLVANGSAWTVCPSLQSDG